jgi:hypothetical protein
MKPAIARRMQALRRRSYAFAESEERLTVHAGMLVGRGYSPSAGAADLQTIRQPTRDQGCSLG